MLVLNIGQCHIYNSYAGSVLQISTLVRKQMNVEGFAKSRSPEQNQCSWCGEESGSRSLNRRRRSSHCRPRHTGPV